MLNDSKQLLKRTYRGFQQDRGGLASAAISFYGLLSLGPLILLVTQVAGAVLGRSTARRALVEQMEGALGPSGAAAIDQIASDLQRDGRGTGSVLGLLVVLYAATRLFSNLQRALNQIWGVHLRPAGDLRAWARRLLRNRLLSLALVVGLGGLLVISVFVTAMLSFLFDQLPSGLQFPITWRLGELAVSLPASVAAFAVIYRVVPDARISFRHAWPGAVLAGLLFAAGKFALGWYFSTSGLTTVNETATALIVVLLWAHYSSHVFFLGAEFAEAYATRYGEGVEPYEYAERNPDL